MNLKEQVLSIDQVRELQELGFDVEKSSTVLDWSRINIHYFLIRGDLCLTIPTLTIGDIMDILPTFIKAHDIYFQFKSYLNLKKIDNFLK